MRQLSEVDSGFRICHTGTTLMLVGLAILTLGIVVNMTVGIAASTSVEIENAVLVILGTGGFYVGNIIIVLGYVLTFAVGAFKLYGKYRNPLYVAAGISFILSTFLASTGLFGIGTLFERLVELGIIHTAVCYVLTYAALDGTIKKLKG
jgi:hypothetical protein